MTDSNYTHIEALLDRSGSMVSIRTDVEGGFDTFIEDQTHLPGKCTVSLAQFDTTYEEVYALKEIKDVPKLSLVPRGGTALLDAIGRSVTTLGERLAKLDEDDRPGAVIVVIMTDGMENSSQEWTYAKVKELIEGQQKTYNWQFLYMGADQDAVDVGMRMGIDQSHSLTYNRGKSRTAYATTSGLVASMRTMAASGQSITGVGYTSQDRQDAGE